MLRINQIKISIDDDEMKIYEEIRKKLKINKRVPFTFKIHKKNLDARDKNNFYFVYSVDVKIDDEQKYLSKRLKDVTKTPKKAMLTTGIGYTWLQQRVVVVGMGPAGLFASYVLAKEGYEPIVIERGDCVEERTSKVEQFYTKGILDEESNIQYGEGGAGTFSDGKLTSRSKNPLVEYVYDTFVSFGAPEEIVYEAYPHLGSDNLKEIIPRMREEIIRLGGEVHFKTKLESLDIQDNSIVGIHTSTGYIPCSQVILAIGNSARDTIKTLYEQGIFMENKNFAVGVRIEHKQDWINEALYHEYKNHPALAVASYRLTCKKTEEVEGAYTFCMCPGGSVVAATSLKDHVCVNGMSNYKRDEENANSALLVPMDKDRFHEQGVFGSLDFIDQLEKDAYALAGSNYKAPAQRVEDFLLKRPSAKIHQVKPSYPLGITLTNLWDLLPTDVCEALAHGLQDFGHKMKRFDDPDALLIGVETRSSSPIRLTRDEKSLNSINVEGLYPCGEGAGYSGGIVSSAIDGIKCAQKIIEKYRWEK